MLVAGTEAIEEDGVDREVVVVAAVAEVHECAFGTLD